MSAQPNKTKTRALEGLTRKGGAALIFAIAAPLVGGLLLVWQAWTLADVLGRAIELGEPAAALAPSILLIFALLLVRSLLGALGEQAGLIGADSIKSHLRRGLMAQLLARSPRATDTASSGVAAAAIVDQVDTLEGYFARYLPAAMQAALLPLIFGAIILPLDWVAGVLFLVTAPLIPVFMALVGWGAQIATDRQARALSHLSGRFADRLRGLLTLKLFGREAAETAGIVEASEALRLRTLKVLRIAFLSSAVLEFFAALGVAGIALYVGLTFIDYLQLRSSPLTLQLGMFLLLMAPEVYNPLRLFASHYHDRDTAQSAMLEIEQQLGNPSAEAPPLNDIAPRQGPALALRLAGVTLRTPDRMASVALDLSLDVPAGQTIALLGPSGSGKSTLLEAIVGLREHTGEILLDGRPLQQWPEAEPRARSFLLTQKPRIVHASLAQNIALGRPGATWQEIESAAACSLVSDFALDLPEGLDTLVGEDGVGLSGGQAQRIALARLFLRDAGLILLDEPTAHLGADMEQEIATNLLAYARGRTMVIATHSEALAARMDRSYRLTGGDLFATPLPKAKRGVA